MYSSQRIIVTPAGEERWGEAGFASGAVRSSSRFSGKTATRGSPRKPNWRPRVCLDTKLRMTSILRLRAREIRAICSAALAGLICGSSPLPERVTASMGTATSGVNPFRFRYSSVNCRIPAKDSSALAVFGSSVAPSLSLGLAGPRLVPPEEAASYPAPAAEGRGWKYAGEVKFCPISSEPMMTPFAPLDCRWLASGTVAAQERRASTGTGRRSVK